jgi:hypothetical protein
MSEINQSSAFRNQSLLGGDVCSISVTTKKAFVKEKCAAHPRICYYDQTSLEEERNGATTKMDPHTDPDPVGEESKERRRQDVTKRLTADRNSKARGSTGEEYENHSTKRRGREVKIEEARDGSEMKGKMRRLQFRQLQLLTPGHGTHMLEGEDCEQVSN